ncbi:MAG: hypothetical protein PVH74_15925 [Desulfobacterales bacterium]|jgi:hypothetical protein
MSEEPAELKKPEENDADSDEWENRKLCSDESCIGVIGPDGRCKECGRPYEKEQTEEEHTAEPSDSQPAEPAVDADLGGSPSSDSNDEWENRKLCSDESCIGVIGPDGRCKECGKPYTG